MKAHEWIDLAKSKNNIASDYGIAKRLGMTQSAVSKIRTGTGTLSDDYAVLVARLCGVDPYIVLIDQHQERTTNECVREAWERLGRVIDFRHDPLVM